MNTYAVVMAAGKGTRMKSNKPKVLHEVLYKPMVSHIIGELKKLEVKKIIVVVGHKADEVINTCKQDGVEFVLQEEQLGTGHALSQAASILEGLEGTTIVLNGDAPLITKKTLENLVETHNQNKYKATIMSCDCNLEKKFGRIIKEDGQMKGIVEFKDLKPGQYEIKEMSVGEYCFDNIEVFNALKKVTNNNAQNEYYLPDVFEILEKEGKAIGSHKINDLHEAGGINDKYELYEATKAMQQRINKMHMLNGVTIIDAQNTYIGVDVKIGQDTVIEPGCVIKGNSIIGTECHIGPNCEFTNVTIRDNVEIKFSVISDSIIESGVDIGPYARLRTNCHILEDVHMGNFVEMKNTVFGKGSKCAHLSYIGDAIVGKDVNVGCGTVTVNYDGKNKFKTIIKDNVFIGCNANLIAPVTLGDNSFVAAGSTITDEVNDNAFAIARAKQVNKEDYVKILVKKRNSEGNK